MSEIKKVVLAYSGGLDTSIIIPWLKEHYNNCEVIAVCGNVGQKGELEGLEERAKASGASKLYVEDLTDEFVEDYVIPTMQAGADDEGYLLGVVREADLTSCKVMTILHPSFNAAGVISRTRENGIINGSTDYAGDGLCVLTNLERATETKMGDQVITTGLGGVFPPDLLVGTVQKVEPEVSGKSSIAVVRPGADPRTVKHVFVITDY